MLPVIDAADASHAGFATTVATLVRPVFDSGVRLMQSAAGPVSFLLRNLALAAGVLGLWRLGSDLGWTQDFFIAAGLWSHWQIWFALAAVLNAGAGFLVRLVRPAHAKSN